MPVALGSVPALVVMGVSGSGKSTVGAGLARRLRCDFVDADDLHPAANIAAMRAGRALRDADRAPWLALVAERIGDYQRQGRLCVVACSALKRRYRDQLRGEGVVFVHLVADAPRVAARLEGRTEHFMPRSLLDSQFEALEPLEPDENGVTVDATHPVEQTVSTILGAIGLDQTESPAS